MTPPFIATSAAAGYEAVRPILAWLAILIAVGVAAASIRIGATIQSVLIEIRWCATCSSALLSNGFTKTKRITFFIEKYRERSPPHVLGRLLKRHAARRHRFILFLNVLALKYH